MTLTLVITDNRCILDLTEGMGGGEGGQLRVSQKLKKSKLEFNC